MTALLSIAESRNSGAIWAQLPPTLLHIVATVTLAGLSLAVPFARIGSNYFSSFSSHPTTVNEEMMIDSHVLCSLLLLAVGVETIVRAASNPPHFLAGNLVLLLEVAALVALLTSGAALPLVVLVVVAFRVARVIGIFLSRRIRRTLARETGRLFLSGLLGEEPVTLRRWLVAAWRRWELQIKRRLV